MINFYRPFFFIATLVAFAPTISAQDNGDSDEIVSLYTNDQGEEVFGPDYMPSEPTVESEPLYLGTPNSGAAIPNDLVNLRHLDLEPQVSPLSLPNKRQTIFYDDRIPYRSFFGVEAIETLKIEKSDRSGTQLHGLNKKEMSGEFMAVHFVAVGQGDGAIVEFPCGVALIDTGGGYGRDIDGDKLFHDYLLEFFEERKHLKNTIDVVFTTHPHKDHLLGLNALLSLRTKDGKSLKIRNVVDNGQTNQNFRTSMGKQTKFRRNVVKNGGNYSAVRLADQVTATGATNKVIDPISCATIDPIITAFWGGVPISTNLQNEGYDNPNNHSVVIRIDFGESSFLFTGDLEHEGEKDLREQYKDNLDAFDVDVYQVSHHGADKDTSNKLIGIMSPRIAVISMGDPNSEKKTQEYAHPRIGTLNLLQSKAPVISDKRNPHVSKPAFKKFEGKVKQIKIKKAIYGTGWDGNIIIFASQGGEYAISPK